MALPEENNNINTVFIPPAPQSGNSNKRFIYLGLAISVVAIIIELVWAYSTFYKPGSQNIQTIPQQASSSATIDQNITSISMTTSQKSVKVGTEFVVNINVDSNQASDGTDLIITFNPKYLAVVPAVSSGAMTVGSIYSEYPVNKVDGNAGIITTSGITNEKGGILAKGLIGSIKFKALQAGQANIDVKFVKGATNESNVISAITGKDMLGSVNNLEVNITQ